MDLEEVFSKKEIDALTKLPKGIRALKKAVIFLLIVFVIPATAHIYFAMNIIRLYGSTALTKGVFLALTYPRKEIVYHWYDITVARRISNAVFLLCLAFLSSVELYSVIRTKRLLLKCWNLLVGQD